MYKICTCIDFLKKCLSVSKNPELEANRIEKWSKIIHFLIAKITPICWVLPKFTVSLLLFITKGDSETVELELPLPMW